MQNIIIGGSVRSGKTTLGNIIARKLSCSKVESDSIVTAFDKVFPNLGIQHKDLNKARKNYEPFLFEFLKGLNKDLKYCGNRTVFVGSQFLPENINKFEQRDEYIIIFLGINAPSANVLLKRIRENDTTNDWTYNRDDEWMLRCCQEIINDSEIIKKQCEKFGYYYFDTFNNREDVLSKILQLIQKEQKN